MRKHCTVCSAEFEAKRNTAKYCSRRCSVRASRQPKPAASAQPQMPPDPDAELWTATLAELDAAGRVNSASGRAALLLARRLDMQVVDSGSSLAAMVREHRTALADAVKGSGRAANPMDELRARRERKLGAS